MKEAHYLTRHAGKVTVIHRREEFRASKVMQDRVLNDPKIQVRWNTIVEEIVGVHEPHKRVTGIKLVDTTTSQLSTLDVEGVFVAIGHKPNSELFQGVLDMDEVGYLKTEPDSTRTNVPGVFAAGDVADSIYRQAVTAAGTGCMAAIDAERWLASEAH
jgi:thioredoxin reductase (NADPH)